MHVSPNNWIESRLYTHFFTAIDNWQNGLFNGLDQTDVNYLYDEIKNLELIFTKALREVANSGVLSRYTLEGPFDECGLKIHTELGKYGSTPKRLIFNIIRDGRDIHTTIVPNTRNGISVFVQYRHQSDYNDGAVYINNSAFGVSGFLIDVQESIYHALMRDRRCYEIENGAVRNVVKEWEEQALISQLEQPGPNLPEKLTKEEIDSLIECLPVANLTVDSKHRNRFTTIGDRIKRTEYFHRETGRQTGYGIETVFTDVDCGKVKMIILCKIHPDGRWEADYMTFHVKHLVALEVDIINRTKICKQEQKNLNPICYISEFNQMKEGGVKC